MTSILNRLQFSLKIWNGGLSNPRDVKYIFVENVCFPMKLKGMATIKLAKKSADVLIQMPNESIEDLYLYYISEKAGYKAFSLGKRFLWQKKYLF